MFIIIVFRLGSDKKKIENKRIFIQIKNIWFYKARLLFMLQSFPMD